MMKCLLLLIMEVLIMHLFTRYGCMAYSSFWFLVCCHDKGRSQSAPEQLFSKDESERSWTSGWYGKKLLKMARRCMVLKWVSATNGAVFCFLFLPCSIRTILISAGNSDGFTTWFKWTPYIQYHINSPVHQSLLLVWEVLEHGLKKCGLIGCDL